MELTLEQLASRAKVRVVSDPTMCSTDCEVIEVRGDGGCDRCGKSDGPNWDIEDDEGFPLCDQCLLEVYRGRVYDIEPPAVIVTISGGVADVIAKSRGVKVIIRDYDCDGADDDRLTADSDGAKHYESVYEAEMEITQ